METKSVFEQSLEELGFDLDDDNGDDFLAPTAEYSEDEAPEEGEAESEVPEDDSGTEDTAGTEVEQGTEIQISEDAVLVLTDGTRVPARDAILFQKDYTKKTQQVAEERKTLEAEREQFEGIRKEVEDTYVQMRDWYESRAQDPSGWIQEIVTGSPDPTATIARAVYELAKTGRLDSTFVETFGLDSGDIEEMAKESAQSSEVAELRMRLEAREKAEQEQAAIQRQAAEYQRQWETIKSDHGLVFDSVDGEAAAKRELFEFASSNKLTRSLVDAYDLMIVRTGRVRPVVEEKPPADPQVVAKKRASRAVTPKSASGGNAPKARPSSVRSAASQSLEEFLTRA